MSVAGISSSGAITGTSANVGGGTVTCGIVNSKYVVQTFPITNTNAVAGNIFLGTFNASAGGFVVNVKVYSHMGYTASNSQDYIVDINFKTSNGPGLNSFGFNGNGYHILYDNAFNSNLAGYGSNNIYWVGNVAGGSATSYSLYMYHPAYNNNSFYTVTFSNPCSWSTTAQNASPGSPSNTSTCLISTPITPLSSNSSNTSPTFGSIIVNGSGTISTPTTINNSTAIATTAYVKNQGYAKVSTTNANYNLSGGGTATWNYNSTTGGGTVTWSQRVIAINLNSSLASSGYFDIGLSNATTSFTFTGVWKALYYTPTNGMSNVFQPSRLIEVPITVEVGENWIFICSLNSDNNSLRWNPGYVIIPNGGTYNATTGVTLRAKSWYITAGTGGNATTPAGSVLGSSSNSPSNTRFNSVSVQGNALASAWNTNTAIFTAPESGIYSFQLFCFVNYNTSGRWLSAKGTCVPQSGSQYLNFNIDFNTGTYGEGSFTTSVMFYMNAGETFYYGCDNTSPNLFYGQSHTGINILKII